MDPKSIARIVAFQWNTFPTLSICFVRGIRGTRIYFFGQKQLANSHGEKSAIELWMKNEKYPSNNKNNTEKKKKLKLQRA